MTDRSFPRPSLRSLPILRRQFLVWRKNASTTLVGDLLEPLIMLLALGYGLGALMPQINGMDYITFLAAGSICMSGLWAATFECTFATFSRLHVQRSWDAMLATPLRLEDVLWAEIVWGVMKTLKSGVFILLVVCALGISREPTLLLVPPILALAGLAFAGLALVFSALARSYDFFVYYFTLGVTPMVFLSGVFFPIDTLPAWLVQIVAVLPLAPAVELIRPLVLGEFPVEPWWPLAQLALTALVAIWIVAVLLRRRLLG